MAALASTAPENVTSADQRHPGLCQSDATASDTWRQPRGRATA